MADLVQSISNSVNAFGGGPSTKWEDNPAGTYTMTWGVSNWGEGTEDMVLDVTKLISNTQGFIDIVDIILFLNKIVVNEQILMSANFAIALGDGGSYNYVFAGPTTEGEDQVMSEYTSSSDPGTTWTQVTSNDTEWT